ncbi:MAG: ankyrin repeat domain-containing protein [Spirochaetia bacterium]
MYSKLRLFVILYISLCFNSIFALQDTGSPIIDSGVFLQNGFSLQELSEPKAKVRLKTGIFILSMKSKINTEIWVSIRKEDSTTNLLPVVVLGRNQPIIINEVCIQEKRENHFFIRFFPPDKGTYVIEILGKYNKKSYSPFLRYTVKAERIVPRKDFVRNSFYDALSGNNTKLAYEILQHNGNLKIIRDKDKQGMSLYLRACKEGRGDVVRQILGRQLSRKGEVLFDIDESDNNGKTGLMLAALNNHKDIVAMLLENQANYYMRSNEGKTALDYARKSGDKRLIGILEKYQPAASRITDNELTGDWQGYFDSYYSPFFGPESSIINLEVKRKNGRLTGKALYFKGLNIREAERAVKGDMPGEGELSYTRRFVCEQDVNIFINGNELLIIGEIFPGLVYKCYVPSSYNPAKPAPLILFWLPGADASPLSVQTAEELGWISIGLYKSHQDIFKVLIDIKSRFNTVGQKIYLAGFSMTGGNSQFAALTLNYHCGGVVCMGNWGSAAPQFGISCFYIFGDKDFLSEQYKIKTEKGTYKDFRVFYKKYLKPKYHGLIELQTFSGGHTWGVPKLHQQAMRWLAHKNR